MKNLIPVSLAAVLLTVGVSAPPASAAEGIDAARAAWAKSQYRFTPDVKTAYLDAVKAEVRGQLAAAGRTLPDDFLAWVDSDPVVRATVYGSRLDSAGVLLMLRSLELDLGQEAVRKKYTQLALASAVVFAKDGLAADLAPRPLLKLAIGGDPRKPVDTKDPTRPLDLHDHVINFLNDNTLTEDVVVGQKPELPELKYDEKGVAIPPPPAKGKPKTVPVTEKRTRTLYAADVIASQDWQQKFNAYMKAKGQDVRIDCGDHVLHWNSHAMVRGEPHKRIAEANKLFKTAYEAKGLLPAQRDATPTPAERCAYIIRNNEYQFPAEVAPERKWPRYPLTAPWPTLTLLVLNDQPLREREERWAAFRDKGELRTYGEYTGQIAQQDDMQAARRLKPYDFAYGTVQMMLKDGGVCGTMANISVRSQCTLGIPACTAGQPGHCALVMFGFDPKTETYNCHGGQYVTAGDAGTNPHGLWAFGDVDARRGMVYHQSIAWAVNCGVAAYLDSNLAYSFYRRLSDADRAAHGLTLLESGLAINPFNVLLVDAGFALVKSPSEAIGFWEGSTKPLALLNKPGCPPAGLYPITVRNKLFAAVSKLPVPADKAVAADVYAFLQKEKCDDQVALAQYKFAVDGLPSLLSETKAALTTHLKSNRTAATCNHMASTVAAAADRIADKKKKQEWALECWQEVQGHESYYAKGQMTVDTTAGVIAKLAGQKPHTEAEQFQPLLDEVVARLNNEIAAGRTPKGCAQLAASITAVAKQVKSDDQKREWLERLAQAIQGHEEYVPKGGKPLRDPCADAVRNLLNPPAAESPKK